MCAICDGKSEEDYLRDVGRAIGDVGWFVQGVEADDRQPGWAYTVGLMESFGHPELVVVGLAFPDGLEFLNRCGHLVQRGHVLLPGETVGVGVSATEELVARMVPVHQAHLDRGLMNTWFEYYESVRWSPGPLEARQTALIDPHSCDLHQPTQGWLDHPDAELRLTRRPYRPNRAERRRKRHR